MVGPLDLVGDRKSSCHCAVLESDRWLELELANGWARKVETKVVAQSTGGRRAGRQVAFAGHLLPRSRSRSRSRTARRTRLAAVGRRLTAGETFHSISGSRVILAGAEQRPESSLTLITAALFALLSASAECLSSRSRYGGWRRRALTSQGLHLKAKLNGINNRWPPSDGGADRECWPGSRSHLLQHRTDRQLN